MQLSSDQDRPHSTFVNERASYINVDAVQSRTSWQAQKLWVHIEVRTSREKVGKGEFKCLAASSVKAHLFCYRGVETNEQ